MIKLNVSDFVNPYLGLNGQNKNFNISRFDIARSLMTIGHRDKSAFLSTLLRKRVIFKCGELLCKTFAYTQIDQNNNLVLSDLFWELDDSEQRTISYYFGQALTKLFAEEYLNVPWLEHVSRNPFIALQSRGNSAPKIVKYNVKVGNVRAPDLIGIDSNGQYHILESKGYSSGHNQTAIQKAIKQVSQVSNINGVAPTTKVACFFDLSTSPILGEIIDPLNQGEEGISMDFELVQYIKIYYSIFLQKEYDFAEYATINVNDRAFNVIPIMEPGVFFGVDSDILNAVKEISSFDSFNSICKNFNDFRVRSKLQSNYISLGADGIILFDAKGGEREIHPFYSYWPPL